jgi:hypothetical protein
MALQSLDGSPLKVRDRDGHFYAETSSGQRVIDGVRGPAGGPFFMTCETANGLWQIEGAATHPDGKYSQVLDRNGQPVARIESAVFRRTKVVLPSGETIGMKAGHYMLFGYGAHFGSLAKARAPYVFPNRYFTLKLKPELLARPDRELLAVLAARLCANAISASIDAAGDSS